MKNFEEIYFAGGCFWGTQKYFDQFDGVISSEVGYANGKGDSVGYKDVCDNSGHSETVKVVFDSRYISLGKLINYFFLIINPYSLNKQGNDIGVQYRTGIYYRNEKQYLEIKEVYDYLQSKSEQKFVVEVLPLKNFILAEEYHQKYLDKNPSGYCHIPFNYFNIQEKENKELLNKIGKESYEIVKHSKTERPFSGKYDEFFEKGIYVDVVSGEPLFSSLDKFDSHCGWPSFSKPIQKGVIKEFEDNSFGMNRIEVKSKSELSHLGHVFNDGPSEYGGLRYCINSLALRFIPYDELDKEGYGEYKYLFME